MKKKVKINLGGDVKVEKIVKGFERIEGKVELGAEC